MMDSDGLGPGVGMGPPHSLRSWKWEVAHREDIEITKERQQSSLVAMIAVSMSESARISGAWELLHRITQTGWREWTESGHPYPLYLLSHMCCKYSLWCETREKSQNSPNIFALVAH